MHYNTRYAKEEDEDTIVNLYQSLIGKVFLDHVIQDVTKYGFNGIRLLVSITNPADLALYNIDWFCYEKMLREDILYI